MAPAESAPSCVRYSVTAPIVGTIEDTRCIPLPPAFDFPVSIYNCRGIPPVGVTICVDVDLMLFLP